MDNQTPIQAPKPKAKKEISGMRKLTTELDAEVKKVEADKARLHKLEKTISAGNERIKTLTAQLSKHFQ